MRERGVKEMKNESEYKARGIKVSTEPERKLFQVHGSEFKPHP